MNEENKNTENKNLIKCPVCNTEFDKKEKCCPNCLYKQPLNFDKALWIFALLLIPFSLIRVFHDNFIDIFDKFSKNDEKIEQILPDSRNELIDLKNENIIPIPLRKMEELSYKTRDEILEKRKKYVKNSLIFKDDELFNFLKNYEPNPEVYRIKDKLPWISAFEIAKYGIAKSKNIAKGISRHSISVNNPEVLISIITPDLGEKRTSEEFSEADYFFPVGVFWDKKEKVIIAKFDLDSFFKKNPDFLESALYLDETNARDLGYNWIFASKVKNVDFANYKTNFSKNPYNIKGFYHQGLSCGLQDGCNNYSPYQEEMILRVNSLPAVLEIKLWKEKPLTCAKRADLTYKMIFE